MRKMCVIGEADPFIARLLQRFAEESGLKTSCAKNGRELYDLVEQEKPRVIIVDVELPGTIRGWQAINTLREDPEFSQLPVITCSWLQQEEAAGLIHHASSHLQKPELHFKDFVVALDQADIEVAKRSG